ncbi:hypothetical protein CAPTEDRAFT_216329, partial [Capitella teleta]
SGVLADVEIVQGSREDFVNTKLSSLVGYYSLRHEKKDYQYYLCQRGRASKGKSGGSPTKSRANSCTSLVSFSFEKHGLFLVSIVRARQEHTGHEPGNPNHDKVNRPDPALVNYVNICFSSGMTNTEAMMAAHQWSQERGKTNVADRRYFLTPKDVKYLRETFVRSHHHDGNDAVSTTHLLTTSLKDHVQMFQPLNEDVQQPLIIVLQSASQ